MENKYSGIVHDKTGQEYRVTVRNELVIECVKLPTIKTMVNTGQPNTFGIKAYKKLLKDRGASKSIINKEVKEYKARVTAGMIEAHRPYIEKSATFENLKFAEGVTVS